MRWYNDLVIRVSQSAVLWILSAFTAFGSLYFVFLNLRIPFEEIVGSPMFDFQNQLTVEQIFAQLPNYDEQAQALYTAFMFVDFYFPFFAGLSLAAAGAFAWRYVAPGFYAAVDNRKLFALFLIPTLFDWCENISAILVVNAYPDELTWAAGMLVLFKKGKLATVMVGNAVVGFSLVLLPVKWIGVKVGIVAR